MTLVDRFALAFATALLSRGKTSPAEVAHEAYDLAEAMLRERATRHAVTDDEQVTLTDAALLANDDATQVPAWVHGEREMAELAEAAEPPAARPPLPHGPGLAKAGLREAPTRARTG
jgi:hypothetical protein